MRAIALTCLLFLAACSDPTLTAGIAINASGVTVQPALSGTVGNTIVSVEPL